MSTFLHHSWAAPHTLFIRDDYETTLDHLVGLSSFTSGDVMEPECATNVLVTHYVDCQNPEDDVDDNNSGSKLPIATSDSAKTSRHLVYLESHQDSICLEIASRGSQSQPSYDASARLLTPGSLRNCGVFSIVTLEIAGGAFQWSVKSVEHLLIPGYEHR